MDRTVIVFSFPNKESSIELGIIIAKAKEVFSNIPDVKVHLAINDAADSIISFLNGPDPIINNNES